MNVKILNLSPQFLCFQNPNKPTITNLHFPPSLTINLPSSSHVPSVLSVSSLRTNHRRRRFKVSRRISPIDQNLVEETEIVSTFTSSDDDDSLGGGGGGRNGGGGIIKEEEEVKVNIWKQVKEIALFAGPAAGLWISGPLMSLVDTAVIGQGSSLELAALGPATVVCDYASYVFMFLSIATSNMVATALARQVEGETSFMSGELTRDRNEVQHTISMLLFVGLTCGIGMFLATKFFGELALTAFTGPTNTHIVPAANTYVQIRGLAWPAILVGWVTQSASLGMKDSLGPLKALVVATTVNAIGVVVLCPILGYGIAGAAWAAMVAQVISAFMMIGALKNKGFDAFSPSLPSPKELLQIFGLAGPVFLTLVTKVAFYSFLAYFATSMGTCTIAAHQVMVQVYCMCTVWGEPLSQTAQSFMPELLCGVNRSLEKARTLLKSLLIIGAIAGSILAVVGTCVPWLCPFLFTTDSMVIAEMHQVLLPFLIALIITPSTHSLEGTLLAGRDLRFLSLSMSSCFSLGGVLVWMLSSRGFGLPGCWWSLTAFQWARFFLALMRLTSRASFLNTDKLSPQKSA